MHIFRVSFVFGQSPPQTLNNTKECPTATKMTDKTNSSTPTPRGTFVRDATGLTRQLGAKDAVMFNLLNMGIPWTFLYLFFAALLFPGVNLPLTVLLGFPLVVVTALTYYFLTSIMPRTGGDFVWVGRIIHPSIGFMNNFALAIFFLAFMGPVSGWLFQYGIGTILLNLTADTGNAFYANLASQLKWTGANLCCGADCLGNNHGCIHRRSEMEFSVPVGDVWADNCRCPHVPGSHGNYK